MAGFVGENGGRVLEEIGVVSQEGGAANVGADADGGDHVGEGDEGGRRAVGELEGAVARDGDVVGEEDGGDGGDVGCFLLEGHECQ